MTLGGRDSRAHELPWGLSRRQDGALRIEGIDGVALLLPPAARGPEALEVAGRVLEALGGPAPVATAPLGPAGSRQDGPDEPWGTAPAESRGEEAGGAGGSAGAETPEGPAEITGVTGSDGSAEVAGRHRGGTASGAMTGAGTLLPTGVWVDPDDRPVLRAGSAASADAAAGPGAFSAQEAAGGADPAAPLPTASSTSSAPAATVPAGSARAGSAGSPEDPAEPAGSAQSTRSTGPAGPSTPAVQEPGGAVAPPSVIDLPVFSGFPEPEPGSGRRRRSPRSALSAAGAGAASSASASSAASTPSASSASSGSTPVRNPVRARAAAAVGEREARRGRERGPETGHAAQEALVTRPSPQVPREDAEAELSTQVVPAALAALGAAPIVSASLCPQGHANPPDLSQCVRCGQVLLGDFRQVPRPVLVILSVSSGEQVPVAGDVVVGRAPQPPAGADPYLVALVNVSSPTHLVSRSHLLFTTAEWNVLVQDLGSANGTVLARPGHGAILLPPRVPTPLLVGDLLDVGDGVTIGIEAPR